EPPDTVTPPQPASRGGLNRRTPGAHPVNGHTPPTATPPARTRDPLDEQVTVNALTAGAARASADPHEPDVRQPGPHELTADLKPSRGGLTAAAPGAKLAPSVARPATARPVGDPSAPRVNGRPPADSPQTGGMGRDPDLERAQLNRFLDGFA